MILKINDKEYEAFFGMAFVKALDDKYSQKGIGGAKFGLGLSVIIPKLLDGDATALEECLISSFSSEKDKPSIKDIDAYIDNVEDIDAFFDEVIEELKKHNATKKKTLQILETIEEDERKKKEAEKKAGR